MLSSWLLSPLNWLLLALVFGCIGLRLRERGRRLRRACIAMAAIGMAAMTPLVANTLVGWLETPQPADASCATSPPPLAVVLAGGVDARPAAAAQLSALGITSRRRVERAVAWWQQRPGRVLVMSGGPQYPGGVATAALMADYARRLGVAPQAVRVEGMSVTTWESAHALATLRPPVPRRVVLATSAMHMPRARLALRRAGFDVCPVPADSRRIAFGLPGSLIPGSSALGKSEAALHELVGLAYYRWRDERR